MGTTHGDIIAAAAQGDAQRAAELVDRSFRSGGERIAAVARRARG